MKNKRHDFLLFLRYAISAVSGMLIVGCYNVIDTMFIGLKLGENGLAAAAITWPIIMLPAAVGDMLGTGASIMISHCLGARKTEEGEKIFNDSMRCCGIITALFIGILLFFLNDLLTFFNCPPLLRENAFTYSSILVSGALFSIPATFMVPILRSIHAPFRAMMVVVIGLGGNIVLDYLFIFVFEMGLRGAAIATCIAQGCALLYVLPYVLFGKALLRIKLRVGFSIRRAWDVLLHGLPAFGGQLVIMFMLLLHNFQALKYGQEKGLAAYSAISMLVAIGIFLLSGVAAGMQPLVGFFHGSAEEMRKIRIVRYALHAAGFVGILMAVIFMGGNRLLPVCFGVGPEVSSMISAGLLINAFSFLLLGFIRVVCYYWQAVGRLHLTSLILYGECFVIFPCVVFVLPSFWGLNGVWAAFPVTQLILLMILMVYFCIRQKVLH